MEEQNATLQKYGLITVIAIPEASQAEPLCQALCAGNLPVAEITFRTAAAADAIKIAANVPGMIVGAGTVINVEQAKKAVDVGAKFIVSPGFSAKVVSWCVDNKIPVFPGVATPTEIIAAIDLGLSVVKLFPAESLGGLNYLKALSAPFKDIKFIPTGGIDLKNLAPYMQHPQVLAVGGSWMAPANLIKAGDYTAIQKLAADAVSQAASLRG